MNVHNTFIGDCTFIFSTLLMLMMINAVFAAGGGYSSQMPSSATNVNYPGMRGSETQEKLWPTRQQQTNGQNRMDPKPVNGWNGAGNYWNKNNYWKSSTNDFWNPTSSAVQGKQNKNIKKTPNKNGGTSFFSH